MLLYKNWSRKAKSGGNSGVECQLPKLDVAGSNPVSRSTPLTSFPHAIGCLFLLCILSFWGCTSSAYQPQEEPSASLSTSPPPEVTEKPEVFAPVSPSLQPPAPSDETVSSKLREEYHTVQVLAAFAHETLHIASLNGLPAAKQQALQETLQRGEAWLQESQEALRSGEYHRAHTMIQQARETLSATQEQGMALGLATVITTINKEKESSAPETPPLSSASVIFVNAPTVNIRQGAGINQKILVRVRRGQKLSLLGQEGLWYHVETPSGHRGWIFKQLVTFSPP